MGTIITGVPTWYVPGIYINVELGRAAPSAAMIPRKELIIGNMLDPTVFTDLDMYFGGDLDGAALAAQVGTLVGVPSIRAAAEHFGYGSELYIMAEAALKANPSVQLVAYVQAAGTGLTADETVNVTSGSSKAGVITISLLDRTCRIGVGEADSATAVAEKISDVFNKQLLDLPYYASYTGAAFTLQAKHAGEVWNDVAVTFDLGDTGVTFDQSSPFLLTGGSGEPDLTTGAFAATSPLWTKRFHYVVVPSVGIGSVVALRDFVDGQADAMVGLRQQGLFGSTYDYDKVVEEYKDGVTHQIRAARMQCAWSHGNLYFPGQLAASVAAVRSKWEGSDPAANLCYRQISYMPIPDDEHLPTPSTLNEAITKGITPLVPHEGKMTILRSVTMADVAVTYPVLDTGKVTVSDYLADSIQLKMMNRYKGFKLSPDTDIPLPSKVTTPSGIRKSLIEWLREAESAGVITDVTAHLDEVRVEIDPNIDGRVNFEIPEDVVDIFAVGAGNIIQIG